MATILYKDGEEVRVEAKRVVSMLEYGYFCTKEESLGEKQTDAPTGEEPEFDKAAAIAKLKEAGVECSNRMGEKKLIELLAGL